MEMSEDLDRRISIIESRQSRLELIIEKQTQHLANLTSKVTNGLSDTSKTHTLEIERLKKEHMHLSNQIVAHSKSSECSHITLNSKVDILEQTIAKDVSGLKHSILNDIRDETSRFIEYLREHEKEEKQEFGQLLLDMRENQLKMIVERRFLLAVGSIIFAIIAPLAVHFIDYVLQKI
jgi:hypothetical protein